MDARVAPQGLPPLADDERADLGERPLPADRLPGDHATTRRRSRRARAEEPGRGRSRAAARPTRSWASRCTSGRSLAGVAVDAVFDSVSVATTFKGKLAEVGIIFCSFSEAVHDHPELVQQVPRLGGALHATTSSPRSTRRCSPTARSSTSRRACAARWSCRPTSASTPRNTGQFERTLIIADEGAYVSYLEGCTAPMRDENQLHAAVVELVALEDAHDQVLDGAELVPGRRGRQGRHLQLRHQARQVRRGERRRSPGRRSRPARRSPGSTRACILQGRRLGRRVLLGGADQQLPAGRHRHQDDPHRQEHARARSSRRASRPATARTPTAAWCSILQGRRRRAQLLAVRLDADRRPVRRAHVPLHRGAEPDRAASSTRRRPRRSARTRSSTATSAASRPRTRCR